MLVGNHLKFNETQLDRIARRKKEQEIVEAKEVETTQDEGVNFDVQTHSSIERHDYKEEVCFFCDDPGGTAGLHCACTHDINRNVRKCAIKLEDSFLLAKLAAGDMIATEAKHHRKCLAALYNKARSVKQVCSESDDSHLHGIAFAELVAFMEDFAWNKAFLLSSSWLIWQSFTKPAWKSLVAVQKAMFTHQD